MVAYMKKLPMAQMLTSDAKLTVRCDQEYVYKGPYDLTKKGDPPRLQRWCFL